MYALHQQEEALWEQPPEGSAIQPETVSEAIEDWAPDGAASEQQWFEEQPAAGADVEPAWEEWKEEPASWDEAATKNLEAEMEAGYDGK